MQDIGILMIEDRRDGTIRTSPKFDSVWISVEQAKLHARESAGLRALGIRALEGDRMRVRIQEWTETDGEHFVHLQTTTSKEPDDKLPHWGWKTECCWSIRPAKMRGDAITALAQIAPVAG